MYLILNDRDLVVGITERFIYIRRNPKNGVAIKVNEPNEAEAIYANTIDEFFPIAKGINTSGHRVVEVEELPEYVTSGYYYYRNDEFTTTKNLKLAEASILCEQEIFKGVDIEIDDTTCHFSLTIEDQLNLTSAKNAIDSGATHYPYHSNGGLCRLFSADEINQLFSLAMQKIVRETTYCNHVNTWIRRSHMQEDLTKITYGSALPEDLQTSFDTIMMDYDAAMLATEE